MHGNLRSYHQLKSYQFSCNKAFKQDIFSKCVSLSLCLYKIFAKNKAKMNAREDHDKTCVKIR